jgi:predicted DNA-binding transcriptional regulator YafY
LERQDFRLFKLQRLWNLQLCDERYVPREIPPEKRDFNKRFAADKENRLVALFDPSEKYQLIEAYGMGCYEETSEGLHLEINFTNCDYVVTWLLGFGGKVKVLEPKDVAENIQLAAENILSNYK